MGFYSSEPGDGTGPVSDAINYVENTYGTLYVAAAGNQADYHWDGVYSDPDGDDFHEFTPGVEVNVLDYAPPGYDILIFLRWNSWPVTNEDYDLGLYYWNDPQWDLVAASTNDQADGTLPPTEEIWYTAPVGGYYGVAIADWSTSGSHFLDLMGHNAPNFDVNVPDRSLIDQATAAKSFSVAAVDASTYSLQSYSSRGPTHGPGGSLGGGMDQPRLAGYANVDTWSYGPGSFGGTSAATPHVSGAAALIWSAYPGYTSDHVKDFLETRAIDAGPAGYDHSYGAGRLYLGDPPEMLYLPFIAK
jgi:subtilisin family serine protease